MRTGPVPSVLAESSGADSTGVVGAERLPAGMAGPRLGAPLQPARPAANIIGAKKENGLREAAPPVQKSLRTTSSNPYSAAARRGYGQHYPIMGNQT